jgi:hypothetical protein
MGLLMWCSLNGLNRPLHLLGFRVLGIQARQEGIVR